MRKDLTAVRRSKAIMLPMILVPALLLVILPIGLGLFARSAPTDQVATALESPLVQGLAHPISQLPEREQIIVLVLGYLLSPLLLVIPLMVSAVLAADAFAGEKERRTLEGLLLPARSATATCSWPRCWAPSSRRWSSPGSAAIVYATIGNVIGVAGAAPRVPPVRPVVGGHRVGRPGGGPALAGPAGAGVVAGPHHPGGQPAGGAVILPLIFLAAGQSSGLLLAPTWMVLVIGLGVWGLALALLAFASRRFTRDRLATAS